MERPAARERQSAPARLEAVVLLRVVGDVLADPLLAARLGGGRPSSCAGSPRAPGARAPRARSPRSRAAGRERGRTGSQRGERYSDLARRAARCRRSARGSPRACVPPLRSCRNASTKGVTCWPATPACRRLGDRLLDQVLDVEALRAAGSRAAARSRRAASGRRRCAPPASTSSTRCGTGGPPRPSRRGEACRSGTRRRGCRASPGTPSSPECRGATSRRSM